MRTDCKKTAFWWDIEDKCVGMPYGANVPLSEIVAVDELSYPSAVVITTKSRVQFVCWVDDPDTVKDQAAELRSLVPNWALEERLSLDDEDS